MRKTSEGIADSRYLLVSLYSSDLSALPSLPRDSLTSYSLGHYNFRRLIGFDDPEWLVTFTSDIRGHPHLWATMVIDINADDRLLQAEALALIRIMIGRLNTSYLVEHMLAPV